MVGAMVLAFTSYSSIASAAVMQARPKAYALASFFNCMTWCAAMAVLLMHLPLLRRLNSWANGVMLVAISFQVTALALYWQPTFSYVFWTILARVGAMFWVVMCFSDCVLAYFNVYSRPQAM